MHGINCARKVYDIYELYLCINEKSPMVGALKVSRQRPTFTHSKNALSSALQVFTSEVGMGSGVTPVL